MNRTILALSLLATCAAGTAIAEENQPQADAGDCFFINGRLNIKVAGNANDYILQTRTTADGEWATVDGLVKNGAYLQTPTQDYFGSSYWRLGTNTATPEWTDFGLLNARQPLLGGAIISGGAYGDNPNNAADKGFDGDPNTYYDPQTEPYIGMDFGNSMAIRGIAFVPRNGSLKRMSGGCIQYSETADFTQAETIPVVPSNTTLSFTLYTFEFEQVINARYVRFCIPPNGEWLNLSEIEFDAPPPAAESADLSAIDLQISHRRNDNAVNPFLSWNAVEAPTVLESAPSAEGPWTVVAQIQAYVSSIEVNSGAYGCETFYRLTSGPYQSAVLSARRLQRLSTNAADIQWQGTQEWGYGPGSYAFDDDVNTAPNLVYPSNGYRPKIVVGFGANSPVHVALVALLPKKGDEYIAINGTEVYGSNNSPAEEVATDVLGTKLSAAAVADAAKGVWSELVCDATDAYSTLTLKGHDCGRMAEAAFYGWFDGQEPQPKIENFTVTPEDMETFAATLAWKPQSEPVNVMRCVNGNWTTLATLPPQSNSYTDWDPFRVGVLIKYKVVSGEMESATLAYRHLRRLSNDSGVIFGNGDPWTNYAGDTSGFFQNAFDGDPNTRCDLWWMYPELNDYVNLKLGIDFGLATNFVGCIRFRSASNNWANGITLYGSNRDAETETSKELHAHDKDGAVQLTTPAMSVAQNTWYCVMVNDLSEVATAYRSYYIADMGTGAAGYMAELEFYGWSKSDQAQGLVITIR